MSTAANLAGPLRAALIGHAPITTLLSAYEASPSVFTRRPAPPDVVYPIIMISPDIVIGDNDGLDDYRPVQERDVTVYGLNNTATDYRTVEELGYLIRDLFHGQRTVITVSGWSVIMIKARGPSPAPVDDDKTVARRVTLTVQLARKAG